jgi:hypothetical protein
MADTIGTWFAQAVKGWQDFTGQTAQNVASDKLYELTQQGINDAAQVIKDDKAATDALLQPYIEAGNAATTAQADLAGLNGPEAQQKAIDAIKNSPGYLASVQSGEKSILSNASVTGGVRGGNTQEVLAQFSPAMLANAVSNQYAELKSLGGQGNTTALGKAGLTAQQAQLLASLAQDQSTAAGNRILTQANLAQANNPFSLPNLFKIGGAVAGFATGNPLLAATALSSGGGGGGSQTSMNRGS